VEQLRLQPLLPGGALIDQRLPHADTGAQLQDLPRRDPRLRQLASQRQPQQQIAIGPILLRPPLAPAPGRRLRRIGQVRAITRTLDLLDHEPPTGCALQREAHIIDVV
jgi:hypothetical protein